MQIYANTQTRGLENKGRKTNRQTDRQARASRHRHRHRHKYRDTHTEIQSFANMGL